MKKTTDNRGRLLRRAVTAYLFLSVLAGCAPPTAGNAGLSKELKLLQQQQLQQQQTLEFIQQQLAQLHGQLEVGATNGADAVVELPSTAAAEPQPAPALPPEAEEVEDLVAAAGSYLEAFSALTLGHYQQAQTGFSTFLQNFSDHRYAPNARYWLAESLIALDRPQQAEELLLTIAADPADASNAPAALFRLSQLYRQQNLNQQAEDILRQLRTRFPESREAQHFNRSEQRQ